MDFLAGSRTIGVITKVMLLFLVNCSMYVYFFSFWLLLGTDVLKVTQLNVKFDFSCLCTLSNCLKLMYLWVGSIFFCPCRLVEKNHKEVASVASLPGISSLAIRANRDLVMEFLFSLHYREVLVYRLWSSFVLQWWGFLMWCCYLLMIDRS